MYRNLVTARTTAGRARHRVDVLRAARRIEERVVWVFGSPRSGSTWLLLLLTDHPRVVPVNEPLIGLYLGPILSDLPGFSAASLDSRNFTLRQAKAGTRDQFFAAEFASVWRPALARMMRERFAAHVARYPARGASMSDALVLVKEPNGSQSADVLTEALPRSRFVFLLRDGRDVVDSELAANLTGSWVTRDFPGGRGIEAADRLAFVEQSARKWLWRTEVVQRAYAAHTGPKYLLRYERMLVDPAGELRSLLAWLGAPLEDSALRALIDRHAFEALPADQRGPGEFFRAASPGLWRENLSDAEQAVMHEVLGAKLAELQYG